MKIQDKVNVYSGEKKLKGIIIDFTQSGNPIVKVGKNRDVYHKKQIRVIGNIKRPKMFSVTVDRSVFNFNDLKLASDYAVAKKVEYIMEWILKDFYKVKIVNKIQSKK